MRARGPKYVWDGLVFTASIKCTERGGSVRAVRALCGPDLNGSVARITILVIS